MPITNALENAKRLEGLGFTHDQAHRPSELLEQTAAAARPDLSDLVTRADLDAALHGLRGEIRGEMQGLEARILRELRSQMFWFFGMLLGLLGVTIAIIP